MKMIDGNSAALSAYEATQNARQKSFDSFLPEAEKLLREWVRDGETIGKPKQFSKLDSFILADMITDDPYQYGLDNEVIGNLIMDRYSARDEVREMVKRVGDSAYEAWLTTPEASSYLEDIIQYLQECEEDLANDC